MSPVGPTARDLRYPILPRQPPLLTLTPPPTSTYTSTHPAQPIPDQASCAANLASINAFLAWVNTALAWTNVSQAWPMVFEARGKAFQLSDRASEAPCETNQVWFVADETSQHRPQSRFVLPQASSALPQASSALPLVSCRSPQASRILPQASCVLPQAWRVLSQAWRVLSQVSSAPAVASFGTAQGPIRMASSCATNPTRVARKSSGR
jgi:hypothetical protein